MKFMNTMHNEGVWTFILNIFTADQCTGSEQIGSAAHQK